MRRCVRMGAAGATRRTGVHKTPDATIPVRCAKDSKAFSSAQAELRKDGSAVLAARSRHDLVMEQSSLDKERLHVAVFCSLLSTLRRGHRTFTAISSLWDFRRNAADMLLWKRFTGSARSARSRSGPNGVETAQTGKDRGRPWLGEVLAAQGGTGVRGGARSASPRLHGATEGGRITDARGPRRTVVKARGGSARLSASSALRFTWRRLPCAPARRGTCSRPGQDRHGPERERRGVGALRPPHAAEVGDSAQGERWIGTGRPHNSRYLIGQSVWLVSAGLSLSDARQAASSIFPGRHARGRWDGSPSASRSPPARLASLPEPAPSERRKRRHRISTAFATPYRVDKGTADKHAASSWG